MTERTNVIRFPDSVERFKRNQENPEALSLETQAKLRAELRHHLRGVRLARKALGINHNQETRDE